VEKEKTDDVFYVKPCGIVRRKASEKDREGAEGGLYTDEVFCLDEYTKDLENLFRDEGELAAVIKAAGQYLKAGNGRGKLSARRRLETVKGLKKGDKCRSCAEGYRKICNMLDLS